jgi:parvulin-like peptidyl-prolyl isomerase
VPRWSWRKFALVSACAAGVVGAGYGVRLALLPRARAQAPAHPTSPQVPTAAPAAPTDYSRRVVAYVNETEPVTRQELGEYLIARYGPEKLRVLVNKRIIADACRQRGIEVTAAEVESSLAEEMHSLNMDINTFIKSFLVRYKQNLYEWKEDVIRPRLLLSKLCHDGIHVTPEDLQQAFDARYGEKIECRIILYPNTEEGKKRAVNDYPKARDSEEAFEQLARHQDGKEYAAAGGKVKPFGRYEMEDPELDYHAFRLQPGEVSQVVHTRQGFAILKGLQRLPANTSVTVETVRDKLTREVAEKKANAEMQKIVPKLQNAANPRVLMTRKDSGSQATMPEDAGPPQPGQVVAWYNGDQAVTREHLGEYLIACFGAEKLEYMVNECIIDKECAARGVTVSFDDIRATLKDDLKRLNVDEKIFVKEFLSGYRLNLWSYCEDVIRQRLLMTKLCQERVRVSEADLRQAFEAYHGERLECRMILWPHDQTRYALAEYAKIRDSEEAFADKAKKQASPTLAAKGGQIEQFGRHTLGDEALEEAAFKLQPGEVSTLIGTPQGNVVIKCDRRIPPDKDVDMAQERLRLEQEVRARKVQLEMGVVFKELAGKARPNLLLRDASRPVDVTAETKSILAEEKDLIRPTSGLAPPPQGTP